jgi:hypothetical protein
MIVRSFADWLCNVLLWAAIVTLVVLIYATWVAPSFFASEAGPMNALICAGVVVVLSVLWPKY